MDAIAAADATLDAPVRELLLSDKVKLELCIFMARELEDFVDAHEAKLNEMAPAPASTGVAPAEVAPAAPAPAAAEQIDSADAAEPVQRGEAESEAEKP
jgi:hypothetical protein